MAENKDNKELEQKLEQAEETKANESLNDNEADNKENADDASEKAAGKKDKRLTLAERKSRHGILATTSVIIVIAAVIALNLFLSSKEWNYDLTAEKVYTLSEQSKKIASSLTKDQEVTIYFLNKESKTYTTYKNILGQYEKAGKHIKVEYKDLELYPNFADDYVGEGQKAEADDMVIVCNDKHRFIKSSEYLSYSYNANNDATTTINMEPKITAAINYCISENTPIIYTLTGHGEQDLSSNMTEALETDNYDIKSLDVVQNGGIPSDGKLLIINAPSSDLGSSVIDMIDEYMENDGKLFVVIDPNNTYPNLNGLLAKYGVIVEDGIVLENGAGYYMGNYPTYLIPTLASHEITTPISQAGLSNLAPVSKGLSVDEEIKNFTVTDLLITSDQSYAKKDTTSDNYAKTDEDVPGPLAIAQVVTDSSGEGVLFVSGSSSMGVDEIDDMVSGANISLYSNAVNYMTNEDSKISIKAPSVTNEYAVFSAFATKMIMAIGVIGIPLFLLVLGAVVMLVRRNN